MLRFSEVLLLLPVLVLVWVRLRTGAMPTGRLLAVTLFSMIALGGALTWFGADRALDGIYIPARMAQGKVVAGHGSQTPVAPVAR